MQKFIDKLNGEYKEPVLTDGQVMKLHQFQPLLVKNQESAEEFKKITSDTNPKYHVTMNFIHKRAYYNYETMNNKDFSSFCKFYNEFNKG